jgi:hypothetical protein
MLFLVFRTTSTSTMPAGSKKGLDRWEKGGWQGIPGKLPAGRGKVRELPVALQTNAAGRCSVTGI